MQDLHDDFAALNTVIVAVAQEDKDLESHGKFRSKFKPEPRFEIVADLDRAVTTGYERTTTYLIDREGVVRQIFPNLIRHRASWDAILREVRKIEGGS